MRATSRRGSAPSDHATPHTLLNVALALALGEVLALALVLFRAQAILPVPSSSTPAVTETGEGA